MGGDRERKSWQGVREWRVAWFMERHIAPGLEGLCRQQIKRIVNGIAYGIARKNGSVESGRHQEDSREKSASHERRISQACFKRNK